MATEPAAARRRSRAEEVELDAAIREEESIAGEASEIRGDATELTPTLFFRLWPLLRRPIPRGFIRSVGVVAGKPYDSTGVRSEQVLINRMNNVLTPLWWWDEVEWFEDGKVAEVTICVGEMGGRVLLKRSSRGGVNKGSTLGNIFKGSKTNASKRAFAAVGPGHEIYLGAADLDPDTDPDAAKQQDRSIPAEEMRLTDAQRQRVLVAFVDAGIADDELQLFLRSVGLDSADDMQLSHALALREKLDEHIRGGAS